MKSSPHHRDAVRPGTAVAAGGDIVDGIDEIRRFLAGRALVPDVGSASIVELPGGVSSQVVLVSAGAGWLVVKRSLPRLRVSSDWPAKIERILTEVAAMEFLRPLTPDHVPAILAVDGGRFMYAMERAPEDWDVWKARLLDGEIDVEVAERLGRILGTWHDRTWGDAGVAARFADHEAFDQLRLDPYYRTVASRLPELAERMLWHLDQMAVRRRCLVHGDFSPKNVLLGDDGLWVLDYEVAHYGDPVFDLAFMLHHLLLKAIHLPHELDRLHECGRRFLRGYEAELRHDRVADPYLAAQTGCLALARVHGKSPAEYLTDRDRRRVTAVARSLIEDPVVGIDDIWDRAADAVDARTETPGGVPGQADG